MLGGSPIGEVAARYGTSRQTLHGWRRRFEQEGMPGLLDRSRRPWNSPTRLSAEVEAGICELRRRHPRWGARRISHELAAAVWSPDLRGPRLIACCPATAWSASRNSSTRASTPDGSAKHLCTVADGPGSAGRRAGVQDAHRHR
ncbi:helix-turn-helix domain-containing protein [Streptomyces sp. NPDC059688]|uniref:helix-turn-helix domain-containing protein n=1 Tax=Streptomyces sp. NPDC059688 TaxID=3346906 RepID=UPI003679CC72